MMASVDVCGYTDRYSTSDGCTCANASDTFCGTPLESLGVDACGDESRGGLSEEAVGEGAAEEDEGFDDVVGVVQL